MTDLYDVTDMAYSEGFSVSVNLIGTIDCDSVKGCIGNCYAGDCYALRTAQRFGWDFHDPKVRRFEDSEREKFQNQIHQAAKKSGRDFARIGVMGDPSLSWKNTIRVAELIANSIAGDGKTNMTPVVITKHRRIATDDQLRKLIAMDTILHTSICPLDGPAIKTRFEQAARYKRLGGRSLIRLITYKTNNKNDEKLMQFFIDQKQIPVLETPLRITRNNPMVTSGRVLNPNDPAPRTDRVCGVSNVDCYKCKEQCGMDWRFKDSIDEMYDGVLPLFLQSSEPSNAIYADGGTAIGMDLEWSTEYINSLPDSAFAVIEPAYLEGKTQDKNARHLPYKDKDGKIDLPHLRNAMARLNQIKPITESITAEELRKKAEAVLAPIAKENLGKQDNNSYIRDESYSHGVNMPEITAQMLVKEFSIPQDKAEALAKRLANDPGRVPEEEEPWYEGVNPWWIYVGVWNAVTDPIWIYYLHRQAVKEGTTISEVIRSRWRRFRGRQPPSGQGLGPIGSGLQGTVEPSVPVGHGRFQPTGAQLARIQERFLFPAESSGPSFTIPGTPGRTQAGLGLGAGQSTQAAFANLLGQYQYQPGTMGVPAYGVPGYGSLSTGGYGWAFNPTPRSPTYWGASEDDKKWLEHIFQTLDAFQNELKKSK